MASSRCLKCGYPLTPGASCFCGTPTVRKRELAPYALAVPRDATEKSAPDERGTDVPVRVIPLPDEERKRVNAQFLEAKRRFEAYQNDPSQLQLLSDAHAILLEMNTRYSDAFRRRGIFDAVYEQVRDALDALLPW